MINYDSILSAFDGKPTLLQWLKMAKRALDESVLKNVYITQNGEKVVFSFNFEDGTSINTPEVVLPKGDKGDVSIEQLDAVRDELKNYLVNQLDIIQNGKITFSPTLVDGFVSISNGNIYDDSYGGYYKRTDYIELISGISSISHNFNYKDNAGWAFFDLNKTFISSGIETVITNIPQNACYVMFSDYNASFVHSDKTIKFNRIGICSSDISNKKFVSYGDSIVAQNKWQNYLVEKYGFTHANLGIGSTTMAYKADIEEQTPCMVNAERIQAIKNSNPDILVIMAGTNDAHYSIPIGTDAEFSKALNEKDKTNFKGSYSFLIETLLTWKPTLDIILLTPMHSKWESTYDYAPYAEAVRDVANYFALSLADTAKESGISKFDCSTYTVDELHPNDAGGKRIANIVAQKLNMKYYIV